MNTYKVMQEIICKMQYVVAKEFLKSLYEYGIKYAVVKGCPLAFYKTGDPGTRLSGDIDILISRKDINKLTELLEQNGFNCLCVPNRKERILMVTNSHQLPSYEKKVCSVYCRIDLNFDLFWGEYTGKRIDVSEFVNEAVEMEIYGCRIKTLPPLKTMIQLILHHYKEMNSLYHLTAHVAAGRRYFEDIYLLWQRFRTEISVENLYEACNRYEIFSFAYYMFYYTRKIYDDKALDDYLDALWTEEGEHLLEHYGLAEQERRRWKIPFEERLDKDVSALIYNELTESDIEKIERNRRLFG